jgi:acyl transferase domain-containing protein
LNDLPFFDARAFSINESEARVIDPQQRLLLETTAEAQILSHGELISSSDTGVYVGIMKVITK